MFVYIGGGNSIGAVILSATASVRQMNIHESIHLAALVTTEVSIAPALYL